MTKTIDYYMSDSHFNKYPKTSRFFRAGTPSVKTIKNGTILPAHESSTKLWANGGVLDEHGNFVPESASGQLFGGKYAYDQKNLVHLDEEVVFFGPFVHHWGHFICDEISRLWFIKDNPTKYKIAYCGWDWHIGPDQFYGNFLELFRLLGCRKDQLINIQKPTKFKKIIIPELSFFRGEYYYGAFEEMINTIVDNALAANLSTPSKVYLSRTKFSQSKERGETKIEAIFKNNGYKIRYPEQLNLAEQITIFNKANHLAMVCGSVSHNLLFTKSPTVEVAILNKFSAVNPYQLAINDMTKASKISYIDCFAQPRPVVFGLGPFLLRVTKHLKFFLKSNSLAYNNPNPLNNLKDLAWYHKKYHEIYRDPHNQDILKAELLEQSKE